MISQLVREHRNITTAVLDSLNIDTDMLHKTDTVYQAPTNLLPLDSIDHSSELQLAQALVALGYRVPPSSSSSTSSISAKERVRTASSLQRLPTPDTSQTVTELTHQLQWTFQLDSTRPFVSWLCDALHNDCSLELSVTKPAISMPSATATAPNPTHNDSHRPRSSSTKYNQVYNAYSGLNPTVLIPHRGFDILSEEELLLWEYLQESGIDYPKSDMLLKDHFQDYPTHSTPKTDPTSRHIPNSNAVSDYLNPAQLEHNMSQLNDIEADSVRLERHLSTLISQRTFIKSAHHEASSDKERLKRVEESLNYRIILQNDRIANASSKLDLAVDQCSRNILAILDTYNEMPVSGRKMLSHYAVELEGTLDKQHTMLDGVLDSARNCHELYAGSRNELLPPWAIKEIGRLKCIEPISHRRHFTMLMRSKFLEKKLEHLSACSVQDLESYAALTVSIEELSLTHEEQTSLKRLREISLEPLWAAAATQRIESELYETLYSNEISGMNLAVGHMRKLIGRMEHILAQNQLVSIILNSESTKIAAQSSVVDLALDKMKKLATSTQEIMDFLATPMFARVQPLQYYIADHDQMAASINELIPIDGSVSSNAATSNVVGTSLRQNTGMTSTNALLERMVALRNRHAQLATRVTEIMSSITSNANLILHDTSQLCELVYTHSPSSIILAAPIETYSRCNQVRSAVSELQPHLQDAAQAIQSIVRG
ncbi:hypothetical protein BASA50_005181 [Batrachochytrium salamandrivorans]|uniref:HAUS augmin-like complex subunit 3 N-terminal domain-containing protein n=1 Tax=Batrachochytrium salamandrivorans TaxID=1357716 RepID=A0ABQ8FE48_9FUNG|nr:hypothetical protein BASA50_005181 [Batrachochytrium salamandrivorans]